VVENALAGVNKLIAAMNSIPGVKIEPVGGAEFVDSLKNSAGAHAQKAMDAGDRLASGQDFKDAYKANLPAMEAFGKEVLEAGKRLASGKDFTDAYGKADVKNNAVDATAADYVLKIGKWQADALATAAQRQSDYAKNAADLNGKIDVAAPDVLSKGKGGKGGRLEEFKADSLSKIGLYNFKANATPTADIERNRILLGIQRILTVKLDSPALKATGPSLTA